MIHNRNGTAQAEIRIKELRLRNFKGIRSFDLETGGEDVTIRGDNATGKTTIADAISWLLFDKDSLDRAPGTKGFEIKTLDSNNEAMHNLEHEVEAVLIVGSSTIRLKKIYTERWTKKRGQASREFDGHETQHFVDDVPQSKGAYQDRVAQIADEATMRTLTDPIHFPERMHWQDRRTLLLEVCGDVSDDEVIASNPALKDLPDILAGRKMDDVKEIVKARRTKINDERAKIPVRIDEADRGMPEVAGLDAAKITKGLDKLRAKRAEAEEERARIRAGGELAEQKAKLSEMKTRIQEITRSAWADADSVRDQLRAQRKELQRKLDDLVLERGKHEIDINRSEREIEELDARLARARQEWQAASARAFEHDDEDTCPACGQALPADRVEEAHQKALEEFNARKSRDVSEIHERGKAMRKDREKLVDAVAAAQRAINRVQPEVDALETQLADLDEQINAPVERDDPADNPEWIAAEKQADAIRAQIAELEAGSTEALQAVEASIASLDEEISEAEGMLASIESAAKAKARIEELKKEERRLGSEYEELERQLYLFDEFTRSKVAMLDERINSRFDTVRFKLFETQINQGLRPCCEALIDGVPFPGANHGARVNAGLEIIDILGEHYGLRMPILVDQSESITRLRETSAQQIRLLVDRMCAELTVVTEIRNRNRISP